MKLEAQSVIVTGGSSGIGLAAAVEFAKLGCDLQLIARRPEQLQSARHQVRAHAVNSSQQIDIHPCDVSQRSQVADTIGAIKRAGFEATVLINSAGLTATGYVQQLSEDVFEHVMKVNVLGTVYPIKALLDDFIERGTGYIVNVGSVAGLVGTFGYTAYCASKFAITGFTQTLRSELKPHGIGVSLLCPPDTDTPMLSYETPLRPDETKALAASAAVLSAEQVAHSLIRGMQRDSAVIIPGFDGKLIDFFHRHTPGLLDRFIDYKIRKARAGSR